MPHEPVLSQFESTLVDSLLEQVVVIDARGCIRWANDAWMRSARLNEADLDTVAPGASYLGVLERAARTDSVADRVFKGIKAVMEGAIEHFEEEYECTIDGDFHYFVERVTPFRGPGGGAVIAHLDITKQKVAERDRDAQRLQLTRATAAAALGQLTGAIAHEISQPLSAILTNAQFARVALQENTSGRDIAAALEEIELDSRRSAALLSGIRELLGNRRPRAEIVDVNDVVKGVLTLCAGELRVHDVDVKVSLSAELPPVHCDSIGLQQVVLNLVINSYEAMMSTDARERRLEISTSRADPKHVTVVIADTGPGLTKEAADRLFDPLFTTKSDGTGLGLSISRSIVEAHAGVLSIVNRSSRGVVGTIRLPIRASEKP